MITNGNPSSAYTKLFLKAEEVLKNHATDKYKNVTINNIDDYFACLQELARIENEHTNIDPIFTILPTTEEFFTINANTREIKAPDAMTKNKTWIPGVRGDEIAEILYFSIDRYFDAIDLADKDILIQWTHEKYKNNPDVSNFSVAYKRSLTLQPGKIVFGWPLAGDITQDPGNILFSVRFYKRDEENPEKLTYSFGTLTSSIKIQDALDFDLDPELTRRALDKHNEIYNNLRYAGGANTDYVVAAPAFSSYLYKIVPGDYQESAVEDNKTYNMPVAFAVRASIPVANTMNGEKVGKEMEYRWYYNNDSGYDGENLIAENGVAAIEYLPVRENEVYNPNEVYYILNADGEYEPYFKTGDSDPFDDAVELYARYSVCTPAKAGYFYAIGTNYFNVHKEESVRSDVWLVPYPQEPEYAYEPADRKVLLREGVGAMNITASVADNGALTYKWYYAVNDDAANASFLKTTENGNLSADKEGYYFLHAINNLNNTDSISWSESMSVAFAPTVPTISSYILGEKIEDSQNSFAITDKTQIPLSLTIGTLEHSDYVKYQWFKKDNAAGVFNAIGELVDSAAYEPTSNGTYRCEVTNFYRGNSETEISGEFAVVCF